MKTILIVEDDIDICNILTIYLERKYKVTCFHNGEDALENYPEIDPNLVLLDIGLPNMNGYEVCKKIRQMDENIPIIFISAGREEQDKMLGLKLGANEYFTKPFDISELLKSVKKYTENV